MATQGISDLNNLIKCLNPTEIHIYNPYTYLKEGFINVFG